MVRLCNQYISAKSLIMVLFEAGLLVAALVCGVKLRFWNDPAEFELYTQFPIFGWQAAFFVMAFQVCFYYGDLYDLNSRRKYYPEWMCLGQSLGAGCLTLGLLYFVIPALMVGRGVFFISTVLVSVFVSLDRLVLDALWRVVAPKQKALILGTGRLADTVARELRNRDDLDIELAGFLELESGMSHSRNSLGGLPIFDGPEELRAITSREHISRIIVALEDRRGLLPTRDLVRLRVQGVRVEDAHTVMASLTGRVGLSTVRPSWFVFSEGFHRSRMTLMGKRAMDLAFSLVGLIVSLPLMGLITIAIRLDSKGPAIYRQERVGLGGRCFELLKFRSMRADAEVGNGVQWACENDRRITRVGRFLRKFRLDEVPQFLNVIRGEMSFVGPRPERPVFVEQLRKEISYYDERHSVRPGITGWAQVQYHYGSSVEDSFRKLEYDLFYLKNLSLLFDCAIVLKTVRIVLMGSGSR